MSYTGHIRVSLAAAALAVGIVAARAAHAGQTNAWRAFRHLRLSSAPVGSNRLSNADMETVGTGTPLSKWTSLGYTSSTAQAHSPVRSLECSASALDQVHGAYQSLTLNQTNVTSLRFSGWSKAQDVSGSVNSDYSVYVDLYYTNGAPLWGQTLNFDVGTHDWQYLERAIVPELPLKNLSCYLLFRNSHTGTVWFDDIAIADMEDPVTHFDGAEVLWGRPSPAPFNLTSNLTLAAADGLTLRLSADGGVITALADGTNDLYWSASDYASGWLVCDRRTTSDWWNVGGQVSLEGADLVQRGVVTALNLCAEIRYHVTNDAICVSAVVSNLAAGDRAVSLCFALPADMTGGLWHSTPRDAESIGTAIEHQECRLHRFGARDDLSIYPLATVTRGGALNLAVPADAYRPFRLIYNRPTRLFHAVFDIGISPLTEQFPQRADVRVWLYRSDPAWGMRAGLEGLYRRFPHHYGRRFTNEGIWVAFADLGVQTNIADFHVAFHETSSTAHWQADDTNGIPSYRYLVEPWSFWMSMPTNIPNTNYTDVVDYLMLLHTNGTAWQRRRAEATLSSGIRDKDERLQFFPAAEPWCPYGAAFYLYASPYVRDAAYPITQFSNAWNAAVQDVYNQPENGSLDGDYIDSYTGKSYMPDHSTNHHRTTSMPLTYRKDDFTLITPLIFGTYEMCRAIGADLHAVNIPFIANGVFGWPQIPIGIELFDHGGSEVNWFNAGALVQPSDEGLIYRRALSCRRAHGLLMNTDFNEVSHDEMEAYMRICAVYGIYPSAFSHNASQDNYFDTPALYERDRDLFRKYIPVIQAMNAAGWQPVPYAVSSTNAVALERYGTNSLSARMFLALRNLTPAGQSGTVTLDLDRWAGAGAFLSLTNLLDGGHYVLDIGAAQNALPVSLQPGECRVYRVETLGSKPARVRGLRLIRR